MDRAILALLACVPARLARHALFLMQVHPALVDRLGYHVRAIHYYDPLPDFRQLRAAELSRRRRFPALRFDWLEQAARLERLGRAFGAEITALRSSPGTGQDAGFDFDNDYFAGFDAALYYAFIRDLKPRRIIEVGCGYSTRIAHQALRRNRDEGNPGALTSIEPYPDVRLTGARIEMTLIEQPIEELDLTLFDSLESGDILFIDSSHAVRTGGDVCRELLDILPALKSGVYVHVHDIFLPRDYPADWLIERRIAFTEQYLLEAFLAYNETFEIVAANHWLSLDHADSVARLWPGVQPPGSFHGRSSFWMRKLDRRGE